MRFKITPGNPECNTDLSVIHADDLSEAIELLFPMDTDDAVMEWGHCKIPLSYKYDLSVIIDDLVDLFEQIKKANFAFFSVFFGSDTFNTKWEIEQYDTILKIKAKWHSTAANNESELNKMPQLIVNSNTFLHEWMKIISTIIKALESIDIVLIDNSEVDRLKSLVVEP